MRFRPLTGISLFLFYLITCNKCDLCFFVPSRGFLFFYNYCLHGYSELFRFSSPHGDFSFSIWCTNSGSDRTGNVFRPLTGISLFLSYMPCGGKKALLCFSSPHGDFSFSMSEDDSMKYLREFFVPSRGFLFFYRTNTRCLIPCPRIFRPLTGISLFL